MCAIKVVLPFSHDHDVMKHNIAMCKTRSDDDALEPNFRRRTRAPMHTRFRYPRLSPTRRRLGDADGTAELCRARTWHGGGGATTEFSRRDSRGSVLDGAVTPTDQDPISRAKRRAA